MWCWGAKEDAAFKLAKELLVSHILLVHFDPGKPIVIPADASAYGIGAVLEYEFEDGSLFPVPLVPYPRQRRIIHRFTRRH